MPTILTVNEKAVIRNGVRSGVFSLPSLSAPYIFSTYISIIILLLFLQSQDEAELAPFSITRK
jgi:hypothetical protein